MPRIYGLMIAKNEADIIGQSLVHGLDHCDKIIVMDNMSTDGTWEIVEALAAKHPGRIIAHCRIAQPFHDSLRALGYNAFHSEITAQDWWLRFDADEFLNEDPRPILSLAAREGADFVRANQMEFALTDEDIAAIERGEDSRDRPIEERRRHYRVTWREFRFFRNDPEIAWDIEQNKQFPQNLSKARICSRAIFNRHYAHRDIEQLKTRIAARRGSLSFTHVTDADWRAYTLPAATQHVWQKHAPVAYAPLRDFWIPRIKLEIRQRIGLALKPA
jgi:glycosyltransferase involved in cell wall biosynthesis